jgi:hypothetical protein
MLPVIEKAAPNAIDCDVGCDKYAGLDRYIGVFLSIVVPSKSSPYELKPIAPIDWSLLMKKLCWLPAAADITFEAS